MKATLREKKLKDGKRSLYLDFYPPITIPGTGKQTRREFLSLYLHEKPRTDTERNHNKETKILAENIAAKRQLEIQAENYGFLTRSSKSSDFLQYFRQEVVKHDSSPSALRTWKHALLYFQDFTGNSCLISQLNQKFVEDFRDYLLTCRSRASAKKHLAQSTAAALFHRFCSVLEKAVRDKILPENPAARVSKIKMKESHREYLTIEELQKMAATESAIQPKLRAAALFSALTGLRFSDIQALTWGNVRHSAGTGHFLDFTIRKTSEHLTLPISDEAFELLGERTGASTNVFPDLEYTGSVSLQIGRWAIAAGIGKPITFHSFRHTFATAQLTLGTDLYTVSKLLGHKSIVQTQIYARIIDEKKREAAGKIKLK